MGLQSRPEVSTEAAARQDTDLLSLIGDLPSDASRGGVLDCLSSHLTVCTALPVHQALRLVQTASW
jgi:hypothetical protein